LTVEFDWSIPSPWFDSVYAVRCGSPLVQQKEVWCIGAVRRR